jgi:hypothetical protein
MSFTKRFLESIGFFEQLLIEQEEPQQFWDDYLQYEEFLLTQKEEQACLDNNEAQSL